MTDVMQIALAAKEASRVCACTSGAQRNEALVAMAAALRDHTSSIVQENERDMKTARDGGTPAPLLDRLMLNASRIESMASALEDLATLEDPIGRVQESRTLDSGVQMSRVSVPLGVVAMVYEARPNVTADAAGICIKSGNACILRGGSLAFHSNNIIADILHAAAVSAGMPANCICAIKTTDRSATDELLHMRGIVDVLIPRGGAGLISHCVENATVPVIETGLGNCHIYVHDPANLQMAQNILLNAKCQRPGVCNAAESLLVDASIARAAYGVLLPALHSAGVLIHADDTAAAVAQQAGIPFEAAKEEDWGREYLDMEISVKTVSGLDEAISHINHYGTGHSEAIITEDAHAANRFLAGVDAAAVYWNASTRFTDGAEFGLGAEIGISTQKLHARGPFALEALTTYKYLLRGSGQVRG